MKNAIVTTYAILLLFAVQTAQAQQVSPENNIPVSSSPVHPQVTNFPYLYDYSGPNIRTFERQFIVQTPTTQASDIYLTSSTVKSIISTKYFDGLNRVSQEVLFRQSMINNNDLVKVHTYDPLNREAAKYLSAPIYDGLGAFGKFKAQPLTKLSSFYNGLYFGEAPYALTIYDSTPLNRKMVDLAPGSSWVGSNRGVIHYYQTNTNQSNAYYPGADNIVIWTIGPNSTDLPQNIGIYNPGELLVTVDKDEDGHVIKKYTDKRGKQICTVSILSLSYDPSTWWREDKTYTYNVYDDLGNLRFVITPQAIRNGAISQANADGLCYRYSYDTRGRVIEKKLPGKDVIYMAYDGMNRLAYIQDGNLRSQGKWSYMFYDNLDRLTSGGLYTPPSTITPGNISNTAPNPANLEPWFYNFYDNYNSVPNYGFDNTNLPDLTGQAPYALSPQPDYYVSGKKTASEVKVLNGPHAGQWLTTVYFYDEKGNMIQQQTDDLLTGLDILTNQYDFAGTMISSVLIHGEPIPIPGTQIFPTTKVVKRYTKNYLTGEITKIEQSINNGTFYPISDKRYDALNRVSYKGYGGADNYYNYNIRSWLTGINSNYVDKNLSPTVPDAVFFSEKICYDNGFANQFYNGNITGIEWRNSGANATTQAYGYAYDNLNRLTNAQYKEQQANGSWAVNTKDYTTSAISYDYNGNLQRMNQRGPGVSSPVDMDKLTYNYLPFSNLLSGVIDSGVITSNPDFKDDTTHSSADYTYDPNGNLTSDLNKKITSIAYNSFNKPVHLDIAGGGAIDYVYDGVGNRLQKIVNQPGASQSITTYEGNFVYQDSNLLYANHEEGRCRPRSQPYLSTGSPTFFDYDYFIKDHIGNVRTVVNSTAFSGGAYTNSSPTGLSMIKQYLTGMEISTGNKDALVWNHLDDVRADKPNSLNPADTKAAQLDGSDPNKRIGPAIMLRVMPGDRFEFSTDTYYDAVGNDQTYNSDDIIGSLITTLTNGATMSGINVKEVPENVDVINGCLGQGELPGILENMMDQNYDPNMPASFMNYLVFDEEMRPIADNSGSVQMGGLGGQWNQLTSNGPVTIQQPGYLLLFASSRVASLSYVDNVDLTFYRGSVEEENHYYPFGLTLTTSSNTPSEKNDIKLTTKELQKDFGLNWYDFGARMHDEQLGRWNGIDPDAEKFTQESPHTYAGNNPVKNVDIGGKYKVTLSTDLATYEANYPLLMKYLETQINTDVMGSNKILEAFSSIRGHGMDVTRNYINYITTWDNKNSPSIEFTAHPGFPQVGPNGEKPHARYNAGVDIIEFNSADAARIEKVLEGNGSQQSKLTAIMEFYMTILHETAHKVNYPDSYVYHNQEDDVEKVPYNSPGREIGWKFEQDVWGFAQYTPGDETKSGQQYPSQSDRYKPGVLEAIVRNALQSLSGAESLPTIPIFVH